jgi:hypothetical protein
VQGSVDGSNQIIKATAVPDDEIGKFKDVTGSHGGSCAMKMEI